jgi:N-acetylglucosamine-6-phosphate deacetylase
MIAFTAKRLYTPAAVVEQPLVLVEDRRVVEITSRSAKQLPAGSRLMDFGEAILAPGFVDIHIHGGAGHDVMESDTSSLPAVEALIARHGVTTYLPTTVTAPLDQTLAALDRLSRAIENATNKDCVSKDRARPVGIHLEGPFISHAKRGVHPPKDLLAPSVKIFDRFWQAARGHIKVMTIAPELEAAEEVIAEATKRGVCISLGHSDADAKSALGGVAAGARHATHAFNAMRPLDHREPGMVGVMLTDSRLSADIIADGIHVHPDVVRLFLKAKGPENATLITDATAATGMPDGRYRLGSFEVEVKQGRCLSEGRLAGSILTMDRAIRNVMQFADWDLQRALCLATCNPARVAGLASKGKLEVGSDADMVAVNSGGEVSATIIGGVV